MTIDDVVTGEHGSDGISNGARADVILPKNDAVLSYTDVILPCVYAATYLAFPFADYFFLLRRWRHSSPLR